MLKKDDETVGSTLAELSFVLVFIFALFAAVGNAEEPDTPNAAAQMIALEKDDVSCLYVPFETAAQPAGKSSGKHVDFNHSARGTLNVRYADDRTPSVRSFLQFYWGRHEEAVPFSDGVVYLHANLSQYMPNQPVPKPYLFLNDRAETAVILAMYKINNLLADDFHHRAVSLLLANARPPYFPEFEKAPLLRFDTHRSLRTFLDFLDNLDNQLYSTYGCHLFYDVFNFPDEASINADQTLTATQRDQAELFRDAFNKLHTKIIPGTAMIMNGGKGLLNTVQDYPIWEDDTD